jgi:hypothetical protein
MMNKMSNNRGGFIQIIIIIIVVLVLMKFFDVTIPDIFNWIGWFFNRMADYLRGLF